MSSLAVPHLQIAGLARDLAFAHTTIATLLEKQRASDDHREAFDQCMREKREAEERLLALVKINEDLRLGLERSKQDLINTHSDIHEKLEALQKQSQLDQ